MKRLTGILLCLLAVLVMSHNTSAIEYGATGATGYSSGTLVYTDAYGVTGTTYGIANNTDGISFAAPTSTLATTSIGLSFKNVPASKFLMSISYRICFTNPNDMKAFIGFSSNSYYYLISNTWEYTSAGCLSGVVTYFGNGGYNNISLGNSGPIIGGVGDAYNIVFGKATYTLVSNDTDYSSVLNAIKNNTDDIKSLLHDQAQDTADAINDSQQAAGEEQAEAAQDAADDSQDSVDGATQSLFSAIGSVITAIKDTNATDCNINITTTQYTVGNVNLCQAPEGILTMIQALAALVIVPMVLMACYSLLHKMYNAFKEVQDT